MGDQIELYTQYRCSLKVIREPLSSRGFQSLILSSQELEFVRKMKVIYFFERFFFFYGEFV